MEHNSNYRHRRSIRLKEYDYSQNGLYFITICTRNSECIFGEIVDDEMVLTDAGRITRQCWLCIPEHYPDTKLHEYVVMPNHVHGIIQIFNGAVGVQNFGLKNDSVGVQDLEPKNKPKVRVQDFEPLQNKYQKVIPRSIGSIIRGFKIGVTKWFRQNTKVCNVWQRNYYEHVIRNEQSYYEITEYIINNPAKWLDDKYYE